MRDGGVRRREAGEDGRTIAVLFVLLMGTNLIPVSHIALMVYANMESPCLTSAPPIASTVTTVYVASTVCSLFITLFNVPAMRKLNCTIRPRFSG